MQPTRVHLALLLLCALSLQLVSAATCVVAPPADGSLGNCPTDLADGAQCSFDCNVGFVLNSDSTPSTSCAGGQLTAQTCVRCGAGSVTQLSWAHMSYAKLVGAPSVTAEQGTSVALSGDGNTLAVGAPVDITENGTMTGAVFIFTRDTTALQWSPITSQKLVSPSAIGYAEQGQSVALSYDGSTLVVGAPTDDNSQGAVFVYTRDPETGLYSEDSTKLVGTNGNAATQGTSVALSADGRTLAVGGPSDVGAVGSVWLFSRDPASGQWAQTGDKLTVTDVSQFAQFGFALAMTDAGDMLAIGAPNNEDSLGNSVGSTYVFARNASTGAWTQYGPRLIAQGGTRGPQQGCSVAFDAAGSTLAVGALTEDTFSGAVWIFELQDGAYVQEARLVGSGGVQTSRQGASVSLSADGNTLLVGGPEDNTNVGASWLFVRDSNGTWSQVGDKIVNDIVGLDSSQGFAVSMAASGQQFAVGGFGDSYKLGAAWVRAAASACFPCEAGYTCSGSTDEPVLCAPGGYCPPSSSVPILCPNNTFSSAWGAQSEAECQPCPTGQTSPSGSTDESQCTGTPTPTPRPPGSHGLSSGSIAAIVICCLIAVAITVVAARWVIRRRSAQYDEHTAHYHASGVQDAHSNVVAASSSSKASWYGASDTRTQGKQGQDALLRDQLYDDERV